MSDNGAGAHQAANHAEYKPRSIMVTGGCGFIGSNFINYIIERYADVRIVNLDRLDYCSSTENVDVEAAADRYALVVGNLNDAELVSRTLRVYDVDTVVHFAAQTHVDNSFGNSLEFTRDNVLGTHTLLECSREYGGIKRFVHISTDEVYGEVDPHHPGCVETSLLNPTNPYAASKAAAEFIVRSYYHSFGLPIIITRGNNVYGPRQYPEKVVPRFIEQLFSGSKVTVQGDGSARRNFIHVLDVCNAVDVVMRKGELNNVYNIGSGNELSVMEIAWILRRIIFDESCGDDELAQWVEFVPDRNFNDARYAINSTALRALGWTEQVNFDQGIREAVSWYRNRKIDGLID